MYMIEGTTNPIYTLSTVLGHNSAQQWCTTVILHLWTSDFLEALEFLYPPLLLLTMQSMEHCMKSCFCSQRKNGHLTYPLRFSLTLLLNKPVWNVTISVHSGWYPNIQQNHLSKLHFHLISGWEMTASECLCGSLLTWTWAVDKSVVDSSKELFGDNLKLLH